jgi:hypothetical protein
MKNEQSIEEASKWLHFTRNSDIYAMARVHVSNLLEEVAALKAEIERKDEALREAQEIIERATGNKSFAIEQALKEGE